MNELSRTRVALVGYGYWGSNLARNLHAARNLDLVAVADADPAQRARAAHVFPGAAALESFDAVLARDDVEAVVLATPAGTHADLAVRALESGRHVLVEKPLATTVREGARIVDAAKAAGRTAMVGHTFLYSAPVRYLRDLLRDGGLGRVQYLYSQRLSLGRIRLDCDALWNFAPHDVSILLYLLGEHPVEVAANGLSFINKGIDDVCFATLRFPSGIGANIHVSWIDPRKTRLLTVVGDRKMAVYDDVSVDQKIAVHDAGIAITEGASFGAFASMGEFQSRVRVGDIHIPHIPSSEPLLAEVEAFGDACATGVPPVSDAAHGLQVVAVLEALSESARAHGAPVAVAP
jgi:predicted dehydrogenase